MYNHLISFAVNIIILSHSFALIGIMNIFFLELCSADHMNHAQVNAFHLYDSFFFVCADFISYAPRLLRLFQKKNVPFNHYSKMNNTATTLSQQQQNEKSLHLVYIVIRESRRQHEKCIAIGSFQFRKYSNFVHSNF